MRSFGCWIRTNKVKSIVVLLMVVLSHATVAEARKVIVGVPVLDVTQSALFLAKDKGFYRKEGLEVDLILMRGAVANQALIAGNVEFTTVPTAGLQDDAHAAVSVL